MNADSEPIRVLVVDDHEMIRLAFAELVANEPDMDVVATASTGHEAYELALRYRPDVVVMDVRMPGTDGIAATRRITDHPDLDRVAVLILTTFDLDEYVYEALRAGAAGFLLKDASPTMLLDGIRVLAAGEALIAPAVTRRLIAEFARRPEPETDERLERLTERELEVLVEVGQGHTNDEIAARLLMSPLTAKTHVSRLRSKLHARDRAQLVVIAYRSGLVDMDGPTG
ncbi:MAG: response regulator [Acidimicrobiales bacterium]